MAVGKLLDSLSRQETKHLTRFFMLLDSVAAATYIQMKF